MSEPRNALLRESWPITALNAHDINLITTGGPSRLLRVKRGLCHRRHRLPSRKHPGLNWTSLKKMFLISPKHLCTSFDGFKHFIHVTIPLAFSSKGWLGLRLKTLIRSQEYRLRCISRFCPLACSFRQQWLVVYYGFLDGGWMSEPSQSAPNKKTENMWKSKRP